MVHWWYSIAFMGDTPMLYQLKEWKLELPHTKIDCIAFGRGKKPLVMIQGLNTRGIRGAGVSRMYRLHSV